MSRIIECNHRIKEVGQLLASARREAPLQVRELTWDYAEG
jgi:hypothetical protein